MEIGGVEIVTDVSNEEPKSYFQQLKSNPFFSAGFGLGILGAFSTAARKLSVIGISVARRK